MRFKAFLPSGILSHFKKNTFTKCLTFIKLKQKIMFAIHQIKEAHSKVKSGADFPAYVQDLIKLGVNSYNNYVADGHTEYFGEGNYQIQSEAKYQTLDVAEKGDPINLKKFLKVHQEGESNYPTFCQQAAESGVEKWTVDLKKMTCCYYDKMGNIMITEKIPGAS
jgi:uncharacterized protein YbcV (DUF1398 family)